MKILVIDDNENITKLLERFLKLKDHECVAVTDAKNALALLEKSKFDATILDLAMPGFTGIDFLESLKTNGNISQNKVVVLTASNISEEEEKQIIAMGVRAVLRKPMKLDSLMDVLVS
ncbi:MAG: response regulator [Nitrososphaeria archaeon]|nr:response regulator [Nitrososphaeria archaeon]NDB51934.1 response regulator [Nitrosopumilaceae archaeon]NDB87920.1 response regulator [Nitrososphaerota archaeon]NDB47096.1 response regulator [Nitrososphaeria archaeon]NDB62868.1 response regulator [Nitrosopumilaceae archaeon]